MKVTSISSSSNLKHWFGAAKLCAALCIAGGASTWVHAVELAELPSAESAAAYSTVALNSASADELAEALNGVGLTKAEAIVAHREAHGPFASVEDLLTVKGIGPATLEKNRALLSL